jgi:cobalt/nickel transport system permease protein
MADALLSPTVGAAMWGVSCGAVAYAAKKLQKSDTLERRLPVVAVAGSFVFAAQMINFSIPATGSSGHIGGGILLAGLLGEYPALLAIAAVLLVQCLFFADGGLLALGANIFNMGVIPCLIIYPLIFRPLIKNNLTKGALTRAAIVSAVAALLLGALGVVLETLLSGITELPFSVFAALMLPIHLAIGIAEGIITAGVLNFIFAMRPELIESGAADSAARVKKAAACLFVGAILIGGGLSLAASENPDGLEWSIEQTTGSTELEASGSVHAALAEIQAKAAIMPDYSIEGAGEILGTSLAGISGVVLTAAGIGVIINLLRRKKGGMMNLNDR